MKSKNAHTYLKMFFLFKKKQHGAAAPRRHFYFPLYEKYVALANVNGMRKAVSQTQVVIVLISKIQTKCNIHQRGATEVFETHSIGIQISGH